MKKRAVLELDRNLVDGDLIMYKGGDLYSVEVHDLLPDLQEAKEAIAALKESVRDLQRAVAELAKIIKETEE